MPTPSYATRGAYLRSRARRLSCKEAPYYLHTPRGPAEPAPGWYWVPADGTHPQYLGYNVFDADRTLHGLEQRALAAKAQADAFAALDAKGPTKEAA